MEPRNVVPQSKTWVLLESAKKGPIFARTQLLSYDPAEGYEWPGAERAAAEPARSGRAEPE